jgi:predicted phage terminase large subunit-like protein
MTSSPQLPQEITRENAAAELLKRRRARSHLLDFTQYTYPPYKVDIMHSLLAETLTDVVNGKIDRLMVFAPPQSGKSHLTSVELPAFWLGNRPDDPVILSSYGASLATNKSGESRAIVESEEYRRVFPDVRTRKDSRAADHWKIAGHRGSLLAVGVAGPVTGNGCMLAIIDDPFENWKSAQSPTIRNSVWEWWRGTFRTRVWEGGAIILIMTRWHEDDLAGRLLQDQPGRWKILRLAALAETQAERDNNNKYLGLPEGESDPVGRKPGEPLTPKRFSKKAMLDIKKDVGTMVWSAEYQGVPRAPEGNRVKRGWFKIVGAAPKKARRVRYWDKAGSEDTGDYTVGLLMAEVDGIYYIEDIVRGQWSVRERQMVMLQTAILDALRYGDIEFPAEDDDEDGDEVDLANVQAIEGLKYEVKDPGVKIVIEQEGGSGGKDSYKADSQLLAGFSVKSDRPSGSKEVRGEPFVAQAEAGNVRLVKGDWNWEYLNEMAAFPNAAHDDQWDGTSGAFNKLAKPKYAPKAYHGSV